MQYDIIFSIITLGCGNLWEIREKSLVQAMLELYITTLEDDLRTGALSRV